MEYFGQKLGQDLGNRVAHPYQEFRGVPPLRELVSKQTVVLQWWGVETNVGFYQLIVLMF